MVVNFDKGLGDVLSNTLRHIAMKKRVTLRPIGFTLNQGTNCIATPNCIEDSPSICAALSSLSYGLTESSTVEENEVFFHDYVIETSHAFKASQLATNEIRIFTQNDFDVLHSINTQVTLRVYYCLCSGNYQSEENLEKIQASFPNHNYIVPFNSKHSNVVSFTAVKQNSIQDKDSMLITVKSSDGISEEEVIEDAVNYLNFESSQVMNSFFS